MAQRLLESGGQWGAHVRHRKHMREHTKNRLYTAIGEKTFQAAKTHINSATI